MNRPEVRFMSYKLLQIFVTVYRENSISAAAKKLNITQPAVSSAIRELEHRYSVQLFIRTGRGVQKTEDACHLYEYAAHITSLYQEMDQDFTDQGFRFRLRLGSSISIGTCLLPGYIKGYMEQRHAVMPYMKIDSSDIIEKMVLENSLDLALIEGNIHSDKLLSEPLFKDRLILVCSNAHPLASIGTARPEDIRNENFLLREKNSGTRDLAESALLLHGISISPVMESTSTTAIINAVSANLGISILPQRMLTEHLKKKKLAAVRIEGIEFLREYHIIYHQNKYLNPEIMRFLDFLRTQAAS